LGIIKKYELGRVEIAFLIIILIAATIAGYYAWKSGNDKQASINSFDECVAAGYPVAESYPEQCFVKGKSFTNLKQQVEESVVIEPYTPDENEIAFTDLPEKLRASITAQLQTECTPADLENGDRLYSHNVAIKSRYTATFAEINQTCGSGSADALYAVTDKEGNWQYIGKSEDGGWACDLLKQYGIPNTYIDECYEEVGGAPVPNTFTQ
jgi:hypothetical protein